MLKSYEWFGLRYDINIKKKFMPESRINKMPCRVFGAADVIINRQPVFLRVTIYQQFTIVRVRVSQVIPTGASPLRHGVSFPFRFPAAFRTRDIHPSVYFSQWRLPRPGGFISFYFWQ